ncbi:uncharacterized protein LY89DRAFT_649974 [Mollisia scopiformis]|uniref:Uncharacterized protein n=1 Tax=Mollisia scopiformis TaxID=149040 RepID=A0A194X362_MOLSC|nr:uncharacterized protein LY89DRAFT_649974 [Mollisia scopiformis]KUJ14262.1 hypothetical protein LY89DRAFT_649974 [Mollisia scopiformis]
MADTVVVVEQSPNSTQSPPYTNTESENGKSPFACNVCHRSYRRVDHLARHYRSHTREKPFVCNTCGKGFSRTDLLKRHSIGHNDRKDPRRYPASAPQLARVAQACTACANSKLKCGNQKPCHRCRQRGIACTFAPQNEKQRKTQQKGTLPIKRSDTQSLNLNESEDQEVLSLENNVGNLRFQDQQEMSIQHTGDDASPNGSMPAQSMLSLTDGSNTVPSSNDSIMDFDDSSLAEFLRDVMMPGSPNSLAETNAAGFLPQNYYCGRDVFNFGMDSSLDFNDMDFSWIDSQQYRQPIWTSVPAHIDDVRIAGQETPDFSSGTTAGVEAFQKSVWRWKPGRQDHASSEQVHLSVPYKDMQHLEVRLPLDLLSHRIEQTSRDKILAMVLSTCERPNVSQVVTSFPSADFLDSLMHSFFRNELAREDSWIHIPTFRPQTNRAEWNAIVVAAGAILSSIPTVRKLGFAIQEAVRMVVPTICEKDNSKTRELQLCQTFALQLSIGIWSGNKRKMEIAECHLQPLITMLRRAGHYRRRPPIPAPSPIDDEHTLEIKWRAWIEAESFKRLAFHTLLHDAQASISLLTRPMISYAEMSLELPYSLSLWRARSALEWRDAYLVLTPTISTRLPSLMQSIHDLPSLVSLSPCLDMRFSTSAILHAMWSLVSEYRQVQFVLKTSPTSTPDPSPPSSNGALISQSWQQELTHLLESISLTFSSTLTAESSIIQELFLMNLHVSFEELQLFAGKEGTEEAVRVYPSLKNWWKGRRARQAIWHAGQILRSARRAEGELRDFYAVAIYHAALCFWVWGMCELGDSRPSTIHESEEIVWLDGEENNLTRRFIAMAGCVPMIRGLVGNGNGCRLDNPKAVMELVIGVMGRACVLGNSLPPLVENLSQLMRDLGGAAGVVRSQSRKGNVYS